VGDGEKKQWVYSTLGYFYFPLAYHHLVAVVRLPSGVAYFPKKKNSNGAIIDSRLLFGSGFRTGHFDSAGDA